MVVPLVLFCLAAWQGYAATIAAARLRAEQTARLLEEHALKVFETHTLVLESINGRLRASGSDRPGGEQPGSAWDHDLHVFLKRLQDQLPQVGTITITDAAGRMRTSSRTFPANPTISFADRDWFQTLAVSGSPLPVVSKSYAGRQSGMAIFNIAERAPLAADGGFGGVVAISVDRGYFEHFYRAVETTYDFSVLLVREDGEILAAEPAARLTKLLDSSALLAASRLEPTGFYESRSVLDGVDRFFAYRRIPGFPVFVRFGISRGAALAPWRAALRTYGIVAALTALCLVGAASMALRQTRRWRETAAALLAEVRERERVETQLRQSQKMEAVGQLTGGIAHDFNNMLAVVIGGLNLAQRRLARGDVAVGRYLDGAMEGATRAATLTQRLLAFARQQPLKPEPVAVNALVAGMSDMLRRTIGETVHLETVLAGGLWKTRADAGELENALLNLAVNARDAMQDGGRLTIETANAHLDDAYARDHDIRSGQYVMLAVTDTGTGMTPNVAARAFDPFFTTKGIGKGTGLGLSQCYGFVKQSAGHVKIYTEAGHGTTFRIYLPRLTGEVAAVERRPTPAAAVPAIGRPEEIILVVEDEERVRAVSVDTLRELGFTVIHAANGVGALALLRSHPDIALLFTDVVMPGMSGGELAKAVTAERPDLKVLFATGYTRNAIVHNGALDPGVQLITKPFSVDQLARKVREVLDAG